jgi:uncharacterized membrane protein (UPF0127 family)
MALVVNTTQRTTVAEHVSVADTVLSRLIGLMGKPGLPNGHGLWITPCADIHSCFMRFAFDAVFVNADGQVVHLIEAMKPWRVSKFVRGGKAVLELPAGAIQHSHTQLGDLLVLEK